MSVNFTAYLMNIADLFDFFMINKLSDNFEKIKRGFVLESDHFCVIKI